MRPHDPSLLNVQSFSELVNNTTEPANKNIEYTNIRTENVEYKLYESINHFNVNEPNNVNNIQFNIDTDEISDDGERGTDPDIVNDFRGSLDFISEPVNEMIDGTETETNAVEFKSDEMDETEVTDEMGEIFDFNTLDDDDNEYSVQRCDNVIDPDIVNGCLGSLVYISEPVNEMTDDTKTRTGSFESESDGTFDVITISDVNEAFNHVNDNDEIHDVDESITQANTGECDLDEDIRVDIASGNE
jgi:hypothetical protein